MTWSLEPADLLVSALLLLAPGLTAASPQSERAEVYDPDRVSEPFVITTAARDSFQELWRASVASKAERVACLGGHYEDGRYHIERVELLVATDADSLHAAPGPSLERCGPPDWYGTAHTHIVPYRGRPFRTFSVNDRDVLSQWRIRWRTEGIFCVVYDEEHAYCEYGTMLNGRVRYGPPRP